MIKNIIVVNDFSYPNGGSSEVAIAMANLFVERGYNVLFFCGLSNANSTALSHKITIIKCENKTNIESKNIFKGLYNNHAKLVFKKALKSLPTEETIVHFHSVGSCLTYSVVNMAIKLKFQVFFTAHDYFLSCPNGSFYNFKKEKICTLKPWSLRCMFCNCDSRNVFYKMYRDIQFFLYKQILKIPNKLNNIIYVSNDCKEHNSTFSKVKSRNEIVLENPIFIEKEPYSKKVHDYYVFVGRMHKLKGVTRLCDCFKDNGLKISLFGDGPELEKYRGKYKEYKNIEFKGWVSKEQLLQLIRDAKCLIVPSTCYETGPLTVFEAMAVGLIPVISEYCAAKDFLRSNKVGYIYDPFDSKQLESVLLKIESNENLLNESKMCYKVFWENYLSKDEYVDRLLSFYKSASKL